MWSGSARARRSFHSEARLSRFFERRRTPVRARVRIGLATSPPAWQRAASEGGDRDRQPMTTVDFAAFVEKLADVAADTILPFFRTALRAAGKNAGGMFDPVTEADRAAEAAMRRLIQATFPHHGIIGEEFGPLQSEAEYVWVLDP